VSGEAQGAQAGGPDIKVLHGNPTAEELAVVVAVVAAAVAGAASRSNNDGDQGRPRSGWTARERGVRAALHPGPGGWRASAFPHGR
jgi:hypothetical protein